MNRKIIIAVLLSVCMLFPVRVSAAEESGPDIRTRGCITYTDGGGTVRIYKEDFTLLAQKISSIREEAFNPAIYSHVHTWKYTDLNDRTHTVHCDLCGEAYDTTNAHMQNTKESFEIVHGGNTYAGYRCRCVCGYEWQREAAHNMRYTVADETKHTLVCLLAGTPYCGGLASETEEHVFTLLVNDESPSTGTDAEEKKGDVQENTDGSESMDKDGCVGLDEGSGTAESPKTSHVLCTKARGILYAGGIQNGADSSHVNREMNAMNMGVQPGAGGNKNSDTGGDVNVDGTDAGKSADRNNGANGATNAGTDAGENADAGDNADAGKSADGNDGEDGDINAGTDAGGNADESDNADAGKSADGNDGEDGDINAGTDVGENADESDNADAGKSADGNDGEDGDINAGTEAGENTDVSGSPSADAGEDADHGTDSGQRIHEEDSTDTDLNASGKAQEDVEQTDDFFHIYVCELCGYQKKEACDFSDCLETAEEGTKAYCICGKYIMDAREEKGNTDEDSTGKGNTGEGGTGESSTGKGNTDEGSTDEDSTGKGNTDEGGTGESSTGKGNTDEGSTDEGSTDNIENWEKEDDRMQENGDSNEETKRQVKITEKTARRKQEKI